MRDDEESDAIADSTSTTNDELGNDGVLRALINTLAPYANAVRKTNRAKNRARTAPYAKTLRI